MRTVKLAAALSIPAMLFAPVLLSGASVFAAQSGRTDITIGTAGTGGIYFRIGGAMASVLNQRTEGVSATSIATTGGLENVRLVAAGKLSFGGTDPTVQLWAYNGQEMFKESLRNLRFLFGGHVTLTHVVVRANSPVKAIADLRGKRVGLGAPGSLLYPIAVHTLAMYGLAVRDIKPSYLGQREAAAGVTDGSLDAAILSSGLPHPTVIEMQTAHSIRILPIEPDKAKSFENLGYEQAVIPQGTYQEQRQSIPTTQVRATWVSRAELEPDLAYKIVKTILENSESLAKIHPAGGEYVLANALKGANIPLHPGADKYYREKGLVK